MPLTILSEILYFLDVCGHEGDFMRALKNNFKKYYIETWKSTRLKHK